MTMRLTPALAKCRAVRAVISPAPIMSARMSAQIGVHPPREAHRGGCERDCIGADPGLGTYALGRRKGGLKQLVEPRPGAARLVRDAVGVLQLPEDLRLAEHHRIESRGDAEGVFDGTPFLMHI